MSIIGILKFLLNERGGVAKTKAVIFVLALIVYSMVFAKSLLSSHRTSKVD